MLWLGERAALLRALQPLILAHELLPEDLAARLASLAASDGQGLAGKLVRELAAFDHDVDGRTLAALLGSDGHGAGLPPKA